MVLCTIYQYHIRKFKLFMQHMLNSKRICINIISLKNKQRHNLPIKSYFHPTLQRHVLRISPSFMRFSSKLNTPLRILCYKILKRNTTEIFELMPRLLIFNVYVKIWFATFKPDFYILISLKSIKCLWEKIYNIYIISEYL